MALNNNDECLMRGNEVVALNRMIGLVIIRHLGSVLSYISVHKYQEICRMLENFILHFQNTVACDENTRKTLMCFIIHLL